MFFPLCQPLALLAQGMPKLPFSCLTNVCMFACADRVFRGDCKTREIYDEEIKDIALSVVGGINCKTLFNACFHNAIKF